MLIRLTIILLFCNVLLYAQEPFYIHLSTKNQAPCNEVYDIFQDKKGLIWLATNEGLYSYDGFEYKNFRTENMPTVSGSNIKTDFKNRIWYETFDGCLYFIENDVLKAFPKNQPTHYIPYFIIDDRIIHLQNGKLKAFDLDTFGLKNEIDFNSLPNHSNQNKNSIFLINELSIHQFDKNLKIIKQKTNDDIQIPSLIYPFENKTLVFNKFNSRKAIFEFKNASLTKIADLIPDLFIQGCKQFGNDYWLLTTDGIIILNSDFKITNKILKGKSISNVLKDENGSFWITTTNDGYYFISNIKNEFFPFDNKLNKIIRAENSVIVGTKNNEVYKIENGQIENLYKGLNNAEIQTIYFDSTTNLLCVSSNEFRISSLNNNKLINQMPFSVKSVTKIDEKYYALASSTFIALYKNPLSSSRLTSDFDSLFLKGTFINESISIISIGYRAKELVLIENKLYVQTNKGLISISKNGKIQELKHNNQPVFAKKIEKLSDGLIILDNNGNILVYENDKFIQSETTHRFNLIKNIENELYVLENNKISILNLEKGNLNDVFIGFADFKITDFIIKNKQLFCISDAGLLIIDLNKSIISNQKMPKFSINKMEIDGKKTHISEKSFVASKPINLEISYTYLSYFNPQFDDLYYTLNNSEWKKLPSNTRSVFFPNLSPDSYHLQIKRGLDNTILYSLKFEINKPFWQSNLALFILFIFILLILYTYLKWQISLLKNKNKLLSEKINLEQNLSKSMLTSIKSQMNPHFFYNALNTIQAYIYLEDKRNASNYLAKFSKLTRMVLEMSEKETITLEEEIQAIKLYLELEKMRFTENFDYKIEIDNSLDLELIKIPSMIIQPYIENAIKHGLLHKTDLKTLIISFKKIEMDLEVLIDDNGIGRKKSEELNKLKKNKYESFSSKANEKRLELLNQGKSKKISLQITDKTDSFGNALGTTIKILIPF